MAQAGCANLSASVEGRAEHGGQVQAAAGGAGGGRRCRWRRRRRRSFAERATMRNISFSTASKPGQFARSWHPAPPQCSPAHRLQASVTLRQFFGCRADACSAPGLPHTSRSAACCQAKQSREESPACSSVPAPSSSSIAYWSTLREPGVTNREPQRPDDMGGPSPVVFAYSDLASPDADLTEQLEEVRWRSQHRPAAPGTAAANRRPPATLQRCSPRLLNAHAPYPAHPSAQAFGLGGLGICTVSGVPGFAELRAALLPLAARFAGLPAAVRARYEDPASRYNFGWSCGVEVLEGGQPDTRKGRCAAARVRRVEGGG